MCIAVLKAVAFASAVAGSGSADLAAVLVPVVMALGMN